MPQVEQRISTPSLLLNNQLVLFKANSLTFFDGKGEVTVASLTGGNGISQRIFSLNAETLIGKLKFTFLSSSEGILITDSLRARFFNNTAVILFNNGTNLSKSFTNMAVVTDPERVLSHDGEITIEMQGDPPI